MIAGEKQATILVDVAEVTPGVAGCVQGPQLTVTGGEGVTLDEPAVRLDGAGRNAVLGSAFRQAGKQPVIIAMRPDDLDAGALGELGGAAGVIDMAVGEQNAVEREFHLGHAAQDALDIAAGVDDHATHGLGRPEQRTILLEGRDRQDCRPERQGRFAHRDAS